MDAGKLTVERLRELFSYDPETGIFITLKRRGRILAGTKSGAIVPCGPSDYVRMKIGIDREDYFVHRLAWLYVYGEWPKGQIDHINGDALDNRICNLRISTQRQNMANSRKPVTNKSGLKGVSWHALGKKWQAHIKVAGINKYLGLFHTIEEAHAAYCEAASLHNAEFARFE